eukprot:1816285-Prymnesium_polylepis.1
MPYRGTLGQGGSCAGTRGSDAAARRPAPAPASAFRAILPSAAAPRPLAQNSSGPSSVFPVSVHMPNKSGEVCLCVNGLRGRGTRTWH